MRSARNNRNINRIKITTNNEAERDHLLEMAFHLKELNTAVRRTEDHTYQKS